MAKAARTVKVAKRQGKAAADGFWDRPVLMDLAADVLLVFAIAALSWSAVTAVQRLPVFPLRQVVVEGDIKQVTRTQLDDAARSALAGNFLTVDLPAVQAVFEKLPWVRRAEVRRRWPDGVSLTLEEQVAVARWRQADGESLLVNDRGEVFAAASEQPLPTLAGPEGSAATVLARFRECGQALAPVGLRPTSLTLSAREAWQLRLDDGIVVELGRDEPKNALSERLNRFATYYKAALEKAPLTVSVVDLRYPNGFALRPAQRS